MPLKKAVVVGAGPAGASAAIGLLRAGYNVQILEQRTHWTGRVCGTFLFPNSIPTLTWLGIWD